MKKDNIKISIKTKLLIIFVLVFIFSTLMIGFLIFKESGLIYKKQILTSLSAIVKSKKDRIIALIEQDIERVSLVASRTKLRQCLISIEHKQKINENQSMIKKILLDAMNSVENIKEICIFDINGENINSTSLLKDYENCFDELKKINLKKGYTLDKIKYNNKTLQLKILMPLLNPENNKNVIGYLTTTFDCSRLLHILEDYTGLGKSGEIVLARKEKEKILFISHFRNTDYLPLSIIISPGNGITIPMKLAFNKKSGITNCLDHNHNRVFAAYDYINIGNWGIVAKITVEEAFQPIQTLKYKVIVIIIAFLLIGTIITILFSSLLLKNFNKLFQSVQIFSGGNLDHTIKIDSNDELGLLAKKINNMINILKESEFKYLQAQHVANIGSWNWDVKTGKLEWSEQVYQIFEIEKKDTGITYEDFLNCIHREDRDFVVKSVDDALENRKEYSIEHRIVCPDGKEKWVSEKGDLILNPDGSLKNMLGVVQNITERKNSEEILYLTMSTIESAEASIFWIKPDGEIFYLNKSACKRLGYTQEEAIGMNVADIDPQYPEEKRAEMWNNLKEKKSLMLESIHLRKDGTTYPVQITDNYLKFAGKEYEFAFVLDISERKKAELKNKKILSHLRHQQKLESIGTLAGGVAHEINNPINGIMNYAQLIIDKSEKDDSVTEFASEIIRETNRVAKIVRNLLSFARMDQESHSPARIIDILNSVLSLINTITKRDQISIEINISEELPLIKCRNHQIQQVMMNLITNARDSLNLKYPDFHEDKKILIYSELFKKEERRWIRTTIEDKGAGIKPEIQERIFDPFFTTKPKNIGSGLGLSISFGIIREHHGEISIDSVYGKYTKFFVDLPVDNNWDLNNKKVQE